MTGRITLPGRPMAVWITALAAAALSLLGSLTVSPLLASGHPVARTGAPSTGAVHGGLASLPVAAGGPVSGALGAGDRAYHVRTGAGAPLAVNPAQHMSMRFARTGVMLDSRRARLGIALRSIGYGEQLSAVGAAVPRAQANRVAYQHPGVSEWYANGPLGLEQGFTVRRPPSAHASGPLTLSLAVSGAVRSSLSGAPQTVTFDRGRGARPLRYGGLVATDASGRVLPSWIELQHGGLRLRVDTRGARYPLTIDPLLRQGPEQKLLAGDESGDGRFGYSVAISADGNTALIGGPRDSHGYGAAWVFARTDGVWSQQGPRLEGGEQGGEGPGGRCGEELGEERDSCGFGRAVALSGDGNTALVGNPRDAKLKPGAKEGEEGAWVGNAGAAWVFTRSQGSWTQQGPKLSAGDEGGEGRFGRSVALSTDGNTALIGGSSDSGGRGAAWIFARSEGSWTQSAPKLLGAGEIGEAHLGGSVALAGDGRTAIAGGPGDNAFVGAAWVFTSTDGSAWTPGPKLTGAGESADGHFGYSVAMSADGATALVGARHDDGGLGAAWTFTRSGSAWNELGTKLAGSDEGEEFGYDVALSADGSTALIGGARDNGSRGAALLLKRSGEGWSGPARRLDPGSGAFGAIGKSWFGAAVALSADAQTALVGGPNDQAKVGAAWVFGPRPNVEAVSPNEGPPGGGTAVTITGSNLAEATSVTFGASPAGFTVNSDSSITAVSPPGGGAVGVTVTNPYGTSTASNSARFTYLVEGGPGAGGAADAGGAGAAGAAGGGGVLGGGPARSCSASLLSTRIAVLSPDRAAVRLLWRGTGSCRGKLKLQVRVRAGKRTRTRTIGTTTFVLASRRARTITVKLNASGRSLLRSGHGLLRARLLVANVPPAVGPAKGANVSLKLQKPRKAKLVRK